MSQTKIRYAIQQYKQQFYNKNWSMISSLANTINYNVFYTILSFTSCRFPSNGINFMKQNLYEFPLTFKA